MFHVCSGVAGIMTVIQTVWQSISLLLIAALVSEWPSDTRQSEHFIKASGWKRVIYQFSYSLNSSSFHYQIFKDSGKRKEENNWMYCCHCMLWVLKNKLCCQMHCMFCYVCWKSFTASADSRHTYPHCLSVQQLLLSFFPPSHQGE